MTSIQTVNQEQALKLQIEKTTADFELDNLYISSDESISPWILLPGGLYVRYLAFDVRLGGTTVLIKSHGPAQVAPHKHRTPVTAITLRGSWGYREYDWVAKPGDYIEESPGSPHTLYSDDPEGFEAYFNVIGALEYIDDEGNVISMQDTFYHINNYLRYCESNNIPVNKRLFRY